VRKDYTNAAAVFAEGYEKYPKSAKGADFLLKLGMSFANAGQKDNACRTFLRLDRDYPQAPSEIKDRSGAEKKRLSCAA
jgi:TolA-binding protein